MKKTCTTILTALFCLALGAAGGSEDGQQAASNALVAKAIGHFEKGFYEDTPKGRAPEAAAEFAQAVSLFEQALASSPDDPAVHKHLARVYAVQAKHLQAARHYQRAGEIDPRDLDALVLAASEYAEARRFAEARTQLQIAERRTSDPHALELIHGYLQKLDEAGRSGEKSK